MGEIKMTWSQVKFVFKNTIEERHKAYRFARWLQMGKELGIVPESMEIVFDGKTVIIGGEKVRCR